MTDILRLRFTRAPQRLFNTLVLSPSYIEGTPDKRQRQARAIIPTVASGLSAFMTVFENSPAIAIRQASAFVRSSDFVGGGGPLGTPIRPLDTWLIQHDDRAAPNQVRQAIEKLTGDNLSNLLASTAWSHDNNCIFASLLAWIIHSGYEHAV